MYKFGEWLAVNRTVEIRTGARGEDEQQLSEAGGRPDAMNRFGVIMAYDVARDRYRVYYTNGPDKAVWSALFKASDLRRLTDVELGLNE